MSKSKTAAGKKLDVEAEF